jgi:SAM-dependent methyltransferase
MYTDDLAEIYDIIYLHGAKRDYAGEARVVAGWVRQRNPRATSLLDVACGTGEHLRHLRDHFNRVEGLELSESMRRAAHAKLPDLSIHAGDMRDFDLGVRFDAVTCLASSIGYLPSIDALSQAMTAMTRHLQPGGVLVIEPWYSPDQWQDNEITYSIAEAEGHVIVHMGYSSSSGRSSVMVGEYLVGTSNGIRTFNDRHVLTLFTDEEYCLALQDAGCCVDREPSNWRGRGDALIGVAKK